MNERRLDKNLKIYPTMHTDYIFYNEVFYKTYSIKSIINFLNISLENKNFDGIIVTGESMKEKYKDFTNNIFNANEVNLDIFNNVKKDDYISNYFNVIYCGRISKEKNIDEMLDCCLEMKKKYNIIIHFIGNGPYLDNLKNIIDIEYQDIKSKIIFHGNKTPEDINKLYQILDNRIFIFTSISETFGKTPMEAGATGIPIFLKKCDVNELLYINKKNAFIFDNKKDFIDQFSYFLDMNKLEKEIFISNSIENIKKYDQNIIFEDWIYFLMNGYVNKNKNKINITILDLFTFHSISKFINCTGHIISD
jgi:glycosyltransferase involved in cell wall biosynthesis